MIRTRPSSFFDRIVAWSFNRPLPAPARYLLAATAIVGVGAARVLFVPDTLPWLLFIPVTIAIALILGKRPGLFAAVLSAATGIFSLGSLAHPTWVPRQQWIAASLFLAVMVGLVMLAAELRESMRRARRLNEELVERERQAVERESFLSGVLSSSTDCIKVLDLDGRLTFMSEGGKRVMEVSDFNAIAGCPWPDFWHDTGNTEAVAAIEAARRGEARSFIGKAGTMKGTMKWWHVAVSPIPGPDGRPDRILCVSRDITDVRASEEERDRFVRLAENSQDFIGMADRDGRVFFMNDAAKRLVGLDGEDITTRTIADFFPPEEVERIAVEVLPTVEGAGHWAGEVAFRHFRTGEPIPVLYSVFPITDGDGTITGYGTVTRDFREQQRVKEQMQLLNGELSHRLKNTLGVVQAIAMQTFAGADQEATAAFGKRIVALAAAHDVLLRQNWSAATLRDVAASVLATFDAGERLMLDGPDVPIGPRATLALSLLLHELATNATKYGALSVPDGVVTLTWSKLGDGPDAIVSMRWAERGGPPAREPSRKGFGSRIIRMGLSGSGGTTLRYADEGLTADVTATFEQLQQA